MDTLEHIPVTEIDCDHEWNCRGVFGVESVESLVRDIEADGLLVPVLVRPRNGRYQLVCGFRRFTATTVLKQPTILAVVRELTDRQAALLNLKENVERENLNILQEAKALARLFANEETVESVAAEIKRSQYWVRVRRLLLLLPEELQTWAAAGLIKQADIEVLAGRNITEQFKIAAKLKAGGFRGRTKVRRNFGDKRRCRALPEIKAMSARMLSVGAEGLPRVCSWAAGNITDEQLWEDVDRQLVLQVLVEAAGRLAADWDNTDKQSEVKQHLTTLNKYEHP